MRKLDERILEHLDESGEPKPFLMQDHPRFKEMGVSCGYIRDRCRVLADANLLTRDELSWFDITTWGQLYLSGEVAAQNQSEVHRHGAKWSCDVEYPTPRV
jgi:hypothetical protein